LGEFSAAWGYGSERLVTGADCWICRFNPRRKLDLDSDEWRRVLHHVTVEVLALAQAGRDVNALYTERAVVYEDWRRTKRVTVKVKNGVAELHTREAETKDLILKAMPQSLAEEIVKAAENAETPESAEETPKSAAAKPAEEENTEEANTLYTSSKEANFAEKRTMRYIRKAVKETTTYTERKAQAPVDIDNEWMQTPLTDPTMKLAVSALLVHNGFEHNSNTLLGPQARTAIDWPPCT
jgi:DNA primase catalytic subunit